MKNSRNAPEWFGGSSPKKNVSKQSKSGGRPSGGKRGHRRSSSSDSSFLPSSSSSSNGVNLNSSIHSTGSKGGNAKNDRRENRERSSSGFSRKNKHQRRKSRDIQDMNMDSSNHSTKKQDQKNNGRLLTEKKIKKNERKLSDAGSNSSGSNRDRTANITPSTSPTSTQSAPRRGSFMERLLGISPKPLISVAVELLPEEEKEKLVISEKGNSRSSFPEKNSAPNYRPQPRVQDKPQHDRLLQLEVKVHALSPPEQVHSDPIQPLQHDTTLNMNMPAEESQSLSNSYQQQPYHHRALQPQHQEYQRENSASSMKGQIKPRMSKAPPVEQLQIRSQSASLSPRIEYSSTYPPVAEAMVRHSSSNSQHSLLNYSGAESDDLFLYSEDESMNSGTGSGHHSAAMHHQHQNQHHAQHGMQVNPFPYGAVSYGGYQNGEQRQLMEQHQMMSLAPSHQITSFAPAPSMKNGLGHGHGHGSNRGYGSMTSSHNDHSQAHMHASNDHYISEDETLMSDASKYSIYSGHDYSSLYNSYEVGIPKQRIPILEEEEEEDTDGAVLLPSSRTAQHTTGTGSGLGVPYIDGRNDENKSNTSNGIARRSSNGSESNGSNANRSATKLKATPSSLSSASSSSGSRSKPNRNKKNQQQHSPATKRQSPPPPVTSVNVHKVHSRTVSNGTTTTGSTSIPSPMNGRPPFNSNMGQAYAGAVQKLSRKDYKRIQKKIDIAEARENMVQRIIRCGHEDALEWSMHVPQTIRGLSRAAGFFPNEESHLHDLPFAIIFLMQLCAVIYLAISFAGETVLSGPAAAQAASDFDSQPFDISNIYSDDPFSDGRAPNMGGSPLENWAQDIHVDYSNAFELSCITALYATSLSALSIGMMMILGKALIPTVLCFSVIICIAFATIGSVLTPYSCIPIVGLLVLLLMLGYSIVVWERIPFAATNLNTALCGIKSSADVLLVSFVMMVAAFTWTIGWAIAFLGVFDHYLDKNSEYGVNNSVTWSGVLVYLGMCISYIWTINVMNNVIHVTIAGVVATWWADPESMSQCCNNVMRDLFLKSLSTSFGSICLGSLMAPPLDFLKTTSSFCCDSYATSRSRDSTNFAESVSGKFSVKSDTTPIGHLPIPTSPLDGIIKHFNDYGFTYVGIYNESFSTSSRKATEVFRAREWVGVSSDRLVSHVLGFISLFITLGSGCFGLVVEEFDGYSFTNFQKPTSTAFFIGCWVGFVISTICLKVVGSAVNTVLVCFSLAPWTFKQNHPVLSDEMRASWGGTCIWLDEFEWIHAERGELKW